MSTNFTFACATVNGLTTNQKRETIRALREALKADIIAKREARAAAKAEREALKASKMQAAIAKAEARLQKLLAKAVGPVGAKARKAAKRPSKAIVTKVA